jgi:hypothetical protein
LKQAIRTDHLARRLERKFCLRGLLRPALGKGQLQQAARTETLWAGIGREVSATGFALLRIVHGKIPCRIGFLDTYTPTSREGDF